MFSGIVQAVSKKVKFEEKDYGYKLSVSVPANFTKKLKKGDSVAVNGVCLTVVDFKKDLIEFDVCLLYTSPSPRDATLSRMPSSA